MVKIVNVISNADIDLASFRMRQFNTAQVLNARKDGEWKMVMSDRVDPKAAINIFHKHINYPTLLKMAKEVREKGFDTKLLFDITDYHLDDHFLNMYYTEMASICDAVTVSSRELKKLFKKFNHNTYFIPEAYERKEVVEKVISNRPKKFVWIGHSVNLKEIHPYLDEYKKDLTIITNSVGELGVKENIKWYLGVEETLSDYECVLVPQSNKYKSPNRFVEAVAAGCIPITFNSECYKQCEKLLMKEGREKFLSYFSPDTVADNWVTAFELVEKLQPIESNKTSVKHPLVADKPYVKLNLGCGNKIYPQKEGWVNIDLVKGCDLVHDVRTVGSILGSEVADEIHAYHVIEHFYPKELPTILEGWKNMLKPGGMIVLEMPCMLKAAKNILQLETTGNKDTWFDLGLKAFYGEYDYRSPNVTLDLHKWAWTFRTLKELMETLGFVDFKEERPVTHRAERDFRLVARKKGKK